MSAAYSEMLTVAMLANLRAAAVLLAIGLTAAGCTDLEADYISRPGEPLYFVCDDDGDCESGYTCVANVANPTGERDGTTGLCLLGDAVGETRDPMNDDCGPFLEARVGERSSASGDNECLLPFQCPVGTDDFIGLAGDRTRCPLGFECVPGDDSDCAACAFVSCNMVPYEAPSASLTGVDGPGNNGCLENNTPDEAPFADTPAGRVYCALDDTNFPSCPLGWTEGPAPDDCNPSGTSCYIVASVAGEWPGGTAILAGNNEEAVEPLFLTVPGSTMSCRPLP